jgi:predicted extracellular nuclease
VAVHLKSKRCSEGAGGADEGASDCSSRERAAEARAVGALMARLLGETGSDGTLLLGDFNSYAFEAPIREILRSGVSALLGAIAEDQRYSYVFQGEAGLLDHAFADARLAQRLRSAAIWHINADESELFGYRESNPAELFAPDAFRSSDHDPLLLGFDVP